MHGGNPPTIAETLSAGQQYSRDICPDSEDDGLNHDDDAVDKPLYDLQS